MTDQVLLRKPCCGNVGNGVVRDQEIEALALWTATNQAPGAEFPFYPARGYCRFRGVPCAVDLAAMRSAMARLGGGSEAHQPASVPGRIWSSIIRSRWTTSAAPTHSGQRRAYERNQERYALLRWTQEAFENIRGRAPGRGIVHQIDTSHT